MKSVAQRSTKPELAVRKLATSLGLRYRLNNRRLAGSPDLSNQHQGWAIFVNGCFWHGHKNCSKTKSGRNVRIPVTNRRFWRLKIAQNRSRDAEKCWRLRAAGLSVMLIWECQLRNPERVLKRIHSLAYGGDTRGIAKRLSA